MALSGEDHEVLDRKIDTLKTDIKDLFEAQINPIVKMLEENREELKAHMAEDESNGKEMTEAITSLKSDMRIGRLVGGGAYMLTIALLISYAENLI